jgi:hypothetical protein
MGDGIWRMLDSRLPPLVPKMAFYSLMKLIRVFITVRDVENVEDDLGDG